MSSDQRSISVGELQEILLQLDKDAGVYVWPRANDDPFQGDPHLYLIINHPDSDDCIVRVEKGDGTVLFELEK